MKKILSTILASSMLLSMATATFASEISTNSEETTVYTQTLTASESDFTFLAGIITGYTGQGGDVVIPSTIGGVAVTSIGANAFQNNTSIQTVTMSSTLQRIESFAFDGCSNLRSVDLNDGLQYLGLNSFANTTNLSNIWIPSSVTELAQGVFFRSGLTSAYVPATVTVMGTHVFQECTSLTSVIYMPTHNEVPWSTFLGCSSLSSLYIGEGVTFISMNAFEGCRSLTDITLPTTLNAISHSAFVGCASLTKLDFSNTRLTSVGDYAFQNCSSLTEVIFPYGFTTFTYGTDYMQTEKAQFIGCTSLTKVVLPSTMNTFHFYVNMFVMTVFNHPFTDSNPNLVIYGYDDTKAHSFATKFSEVGWSSLGAVSNENQNPSLVPAPVPTLPTKASTTASTPTVTPTVDSNASAESDFVLGDGGVISKYTGAGGDVVIPSTIGGNVVYGIGANAFQNNTAITSVTMPNTLERIEANAFDGCTALTSVTLNEGIKYLGHYAFASCSGLTSVWFPSTLTEIGDYTFYKSGLTSVYVPNTVRIFGTRVFCECTNLTSAIFMPNHKEVPLSTFYGCTNLSSVYVGEGISFVSMYAFSGCTALTDISLPTTLDTISLYAFEYCTSLVSMDFSNTKLTNLRYYAFRDCTSLQEVIFPYGFTTFEVGDDYMQTEKASFVGCSSLVKVVLPSTVTDCYYYYSIPNYSVGTLLNHLTGNWDLLNHPFIECNANLVVYSYPNSNVSAMASHTEEFRLSTLTASDENKNPTLTPVAVPTLPTAPTVESTPTVTPTTPQVDSNTKTATPSDVKVMVNGSFVGFAPYSIDGFNYFKLTDMAFAIDGTGKQFQVTWDMEKSAINMVTGSAHKHLGNEMEGNSGKSEVAERFTSTVYKNGEAIDVLVYTIDGSSYFQLDTLKSVLGIDVGWDGATGTITITT